MFAGEREFIDVVADVGELCDEALDARLRSVEGLERQLAAERSALLAECERRRTYRPEHATIYGQLRASLGWSERDCKDATQLARLIDAHPDVGDSLFEHSMPVAAALELARAFARTGDELDPVIGAFCRLAERVEHDEFSLRVRAWVKRTLAATDGGDDPMHTHEARNAHWHADGDGGGLAVEWGAVDAIAAREILDRYLEAEWMADWDATVAAYGDDASKLLMPRTDAQRRADAVTRALTDAASRPAGSKAPEPVVNVHVDHATFTDLLTEAAVLPERDVDPFDDPTPHVAPHVTERMNHTDHGDPLDPRIILQLLIEGHIRWVIRNDRGIPIRWGRRKRLFDGAAREAVRSLSTRCIHPGCRVPTRRTQTDHLAEWSQGGLTDPDNGGPSCRRHNATKTAGGYTVHRDHAGRWHTYRPDGTLVD